MIPWVHLDTATVPGGGGELKLMQRGDEFSIMAGGIELMNSRLSDSEQALARLARERIGDRPRPRVLIGGLGMGFTLRAALEVFGPQAEIVVAELVPAVLAWGRGPLAGLYGDSLADPRATVRIIDVADLIDSPPGSWDAILLDVDNGPKGLSRAGNNGLYNGRGLGVAKKSLRPGGVLGVWSSTPDHAFTGRLQRSGFEVKETMVRAHRGRGARHIVWMAATPG
jgi:spermidine synthase